MEEIKFGYFKDGKIYLKGYLDFPDREIGEIKVDKESTRKYFEERFEIAKKKVETLEKKINEAENKGSYLMKLIHLRKFLSEFDAIGDFVPLFQKLDQLEAQLNEIIAINRVKNLEIKRALLAEAEMVKDMDDLKAATEKVKELKEKWIRTGSIEKDYQEEVEDKFKEILDYFYDRKKDAYEERQKQIQKNIAEYETLIKQAEELKDKNNVFHAIKEIKNIQQQWKTLGRIPVKEKNELWNKFKSIKDEIFNRRNKESKKRERRVPGKGNIEEKQKLLEKAISLQERNDNIAVNEIKKLQKMWNQSGKIYEKGSRELSEKFFQACDQVIEQNFLEKLAHGKSRNFEVKDASEKTKIKIKLLSDLINRDEKEIELYEENYQKFNPGGHSINKLINSKLYAKKRKLVVKKKILIDLKQSLTEDN